MSDKPIYGYLTDDLKLRAKPESDSIENTGFILKIIDTNSDKVHVELRHVDTGNVYDEYINPKELIGIMQYSVFAGLTCKDKVYIGMPLANKVLNDPYVLFTDGNKEIEENTRKYIANRYEVNSELTKHKKTKKWVPGRIYSTQTFQVQSLYLGEVHTGFDRFKSYFVKLGNNDKVKHLTINMAAFTDKQFTKLSEILAYQKQEFEKGINNIKNTLSKHRVYIDSEIPELLSSIGMTTEWSGKAAGAKYMLDAPALRAETGSVELDISIDDYINELYTAVHSKITELLEYMLTFKKSKKEIEKDMETYGHEVEICTKWDMDDFLKCLGYTNFCTAGKEAKLKSDTLYTIKLLEKELKERYDITLGIIEN